jgi:hypothetical protein
MLATGTHLNLIVPPFLLTFIPISVANLEKEILFFLFALQKGKTNHPSNNSEVN